MASTSTAVAAAWSPGTDRTMWWAIGSGSSDAPEIETDSAAEEAGEG